MVGRRVSMCRVLLDRLAVTSSALELADAPQAANTASSPRARILAAQRTACPCRIARSAACVPSPPVAVGILARPHFRRGLDGQRGGHTPEAALDQEQADKAEQHAEPERGEAD